MKQHVIKYALLGVLTVSALGLAQTDPAQAPTDQAQPGYTGTIPLPQDNGDEGSEAAAYQALAKVTLEQAVQAAQQSLGVTTAPSSAQLGNENGFLIWEVVIGDQAVKVDAGDAKILQTEPLANEQMGEENGEDNNETMNENEGDNENNDGDMESNDDGSESEQEGAEGGESN